MDLHLELQTRSGFPFATGFSQPELEGMLEQAVLERQIPFIRGYGEAIESPQYDVLKGNLTSLYVYQLYKGWSNTQIGLWLLSAGFPGRIAQPQHPTAKIYSA